MSELYLKELVIASAAARGEHTPRAGEGDHIIAWDGTNIKYEGKKVNHG